MTAEALQEFVDFCWAQAAGHQALHDLLVWSYCQGFKDPCRALFMLGYNDCAGHILRGKE